MPDEQFPSLQALLREIEAQAAHHSSLPGLLARVISRLAASEADPYLLLGVLAEAVPQLIAARIPAECQTEVAAEALALVHERLLANGLLGDDAD